MKLLLDEDTQSHVLIRLLKEAGHDVETVSGTGLAGQADPAVLAYASSHGRVLLTRNGRDFLALHQASSDHAGILVEYQDADPSKNMTYQQVTAAIGKIAASGWHLAGVVVSINAWQ